MTPTPLTAGELLAILAVLLVRLGKDHPLTRRVRALQATASLARPGTGSGATNSPDWHPNPNPTPNGPQNAETEQ